MKTFFITLLLALSFAASAQLTISCTYREEGTWDSKAQKWNINATDEKLTVFNFKKDLSSFRHITSTTSSVYTVTDWDYTEEETLYEMNVKSDAGNEYEMMIDGENDYVIFFYTDSNEKYRMIRFTIKESWYDE